MGKISWTQFVQNEVLRTVNGERNEYLTYNKTKED